MRSALASFVPAVAIGAYYLFGDDAGDTFVVIIAALGFLLTLDGVLLSTYIFRNHLGLATWPRTAITTAATTAILLAIVPTVPRWPFEDLGLMISWLTVSAAVTAAAILIGKVGTPNKRLERTREG